MEMTTIKPEKKKLEKKLAVILSIMWPGMGLILLSKRTPGIIFAIIHILSIFLVAGIVIMSITDNRYIQEMLLMVSLALLVGNWFISLTKTKIELSTDEE